MSNNQAKNLNANKFNALQGFDGLEVCGVVNFIDGCDGTGGSPARVTRMLRSGCVCGAMSVNAPGGNYVGANAGATTLLGRGLVADP
jgi:hypothetical protein